MHSEAHPQNIRDSSLALDAAGNLYGTTAESDSTTCTGGQGGCGVVFELTPTSTGWSYTELYAFKGGQDGSDPTYSLILDAGGQHLRDDFVRRRFANLLRRLRHSFRVNAQLNRGFNRERAVPLSGRK